MSERTGGVAGEPSVSTASPSPAPLAVLIVEDHEFQRTTLARMTLALGASEVLKAADGVEALAMLRDRRDEVQLIICDLDMPNMDGMEFIRHLGGIGTAASLVITSTMDESILNSVYTMCQAYGIVPLGMLEKPMTRPALAALLQQARVSRPASPQRPAAPAAPFSLQQILQGMHSDEFEPFFQAKIDLDTGRIVGAEALARWRHPEHGIVAPGAFIEELEQGSQIEAFTFLMLRRASAACSAWRGRGLDLNVSVNLSLASLGDTALADRIAATVIQAGLEARHVTLEITETAAMTNIAPALENLARLRIRGFGLSIDDFGTGFSSMEQLGRVAFTELKIDRGFVSAMATRREARAIVESSVDMARRLGIRSVAEGIENQAEWDTLKAMGCDLGQGYFISHPLAEREFLALYAGRCR